MLISRSEHSKLEEIPSSSKSGILLDNKDSKLSLLHITKALTESSLSTISPIDNHSKISKTGLLKLISMATRMLSNSLLVTSLILNLTDKSKLKKEKLSLNL